MQTQTRHNKTTGYQDKEKNKSSNLYRASGGGGNASPKELHHMINKKNEEHQHPFKFPQNKPQNFQTTQTEWKAAVFNDDVEINVKNPQTQSYC